LHPSCNLIIWLALTLALQTLGFAGALLLGAALPALGGALLRAWRRQVWRARWLLLALWLILAWGAPGEAWQGISWAPTYEGMEIASLHTLRLIVMLGLLAWLLESLGRDGLVSALWGLLHACRAIGIDPRPLVVRLALVLGNLQAPPEKGAWRHLLDGRRQSAGPATLNLSLPRWAARDTVLAGAALAGLLAALIA